MGSPTSPTAQKESWEGPRLPGGRGPGRCPSGTWAGCTGAGELSLVTAGFSPPPTASKGEFYYPPPPHPPLFVYGNNNATTNKSSVISYWDIVGIIYGILQAVRYMYICHCLSVFLQGIQQHQQVEGDRWNARPRRQWSLKNGHPHQSYHKSKSRDVWIHVTKSTNQILWNMTGILHVT